MNKCNNYYQTGGKLHLQIVCIVQLLNEGNRDWLLSRVAIILFNVLILMAMDL